MTRASEDDRLDRRQLLKTVGFGMATGTVFGAPASGARTGQESEASVTFEDQSSDGTSVVVVEARTEVPAHLAVFDVQGDARVDGPPVELAAGETATDITVGLDPPLEESQQLRATVIERNGSDIASDTAFIEVGSDEVVARGTDPKLVEPPASAGFEYPYYLYAPPLTSDRDPRPVMVQPVNTGQPSDDFSLHREAARRRITESWTRRVADELTVPLLVPVFPRPESDPVDDRHDPHSLDAFTMHITEGPLARVDLQLKRMIEHARQRLAADGYPVATDLVLNGFSASGTFVNRWAAMHPENVLSLSAGGTNGMVILPIEEAEGHTLNYQLGVADFESLLGEPFDREAFAEIEQFLYLGQLDGNDWLPQRHADNVYGNQSRIAFDVFGPDPQRDRFPYCQTVYEDVGASAHFRIYERVGHNPLPAVEDVVEFHRRVMAGADLDGFGEDLGTGGGSGAPPAAAFDYSPEAPVAGERVAFDGTPSTTPGEEIVMYSWTFGDGTTASGAEPTHRFAEPGEYTVTLAVADGRGRTGEARTTVDVGAGGTGEQDADTSSRIPGVGALMAVAGIGTAAGYLARRTDEDER